jgi:sarcosine oxidase
VPSSASLGKQDIETEFTTFVGPRLREYDYIVVGAGGMGTSIAYYLSDSPGRTLVLERFVENHTQGSSHGKTRILRTAYAEGSVYVPLVLRARRLWQRLGRDVGRTIFQPTGVLLAGRATSSDLAMARKSARSHDLLYEWLPAASAQQRFPAFRFDSGDAALWDPGGGVLFPERAISAFRRETHRRGTLFQWNSPVERWAPRADGRIVVSTGRREYLADQLILSVGAWLPSLVPELRLPLAVEQQSVYWFRAAGRARRPYQVMPAFVWYSARGTYFYGTPDFGDGVKVGGSRGQRVRDPGRRPPASSRELRSVRRFSKDRLPGLPSKATRQTRCLYTNTPDRNFIVDFHPENPHVILVSACSGHGFKFASAIGELVAEAANAGRLPPMLTPFRLSP